MYGAIALLNQPLPKRELTSQRFAIALSNQHKQNRTPKPTPTKQRSHTQTNTKPNSDRILKPT